MKVLELRVDDSIFDKFKSILELMPKNKIKMKEIFDDSHIHFVTEEEQKDIERKLQMKSYHVISCSKTIKI
jgi:hypothetical protein